MQTIDKDENTQNYVTCTVFIIFLFCGLPLWWKTTEVYRAVLPHTEIQSLYKNNLVKIKINILLKSDDEPTIPSELQETLQMDLNFASMCKNQSFLTFSYKVDHLKDTKVVDKPGQIIVVFKQGDPLIEVTSKRNIIVSSPDFREFKTSQLTTVIKNVIVNENFLCNAGSEMLEEIRKETDNSAHLQKMVKGGSRYELLFSLLLSKSETRFFDWNIKEAIDKKLAGFLHQLKDAYEINVSSQILFSNPAYLQIHKSTGNETYNYVTEEQLSQVVNRVESRLGSQISPDPTLSMVVHLVDESHQPLYILKETNKISVTNSFLIPRWGAMILHNTHNNTSNVLDVNRLMPVFVGHLRVLLGGLNNRLFLTREENLVKYQPPRNTGITQWELDFLFRLRIVQNVASAVHTLNSLTKLLDKIKDIVINDNVGKEIYTAVNSIKQAKVYLNDNNLKLAMHESKIAFKSSEKAFFDPTLMELLYFPADQKFAIYLPLFFPLVFTVLISMGFTIKRWKGKVKTE